MITSAEYLKRMQLRKPTVYMWGEKIDVPIDHPQIRPNFNAIATAYDLPLEPKHQDLMTVSSPITGERVNRFNSLYQSTDDLLKKVEMIRTIVTETGAPCINRCVGSDALQTIGIMSYEIDQQLGTNYHKRLLDYMKYYQENDLSAAGAVTDVKGDRNLRPHQQADPDLYTRIVERRKDGIVVRGAKCSISHAVVCDELVVVPNRGLTEKDSDYAVAFAIPIDTKGVTFINVAKAPARQPIMECPVSRRYAFSDAMIVFDDVFVPSERVFLNGEWQFGGRMGALFGHFHRLSHCGCIPGRSELLVGVASLAAKYNGISDKSHVRSKLVDLIAHGEMVYACGIAAAIKGTRTPSGIYQPAVLYSNAGKFYESENTNSDLGKLADICGGILITMPSEADYFSPDTGKYMKKYLRGTVDAEDRIKLFHLAADLCTTRWGANMGVGEVLGAGSPEAQRHAIYSSYDFEKPEALAKRLADIGT